MEPDVSLAPSPELLLLLAVPVALGVGASGDSEFVAVEGAVGDADGGTVRSSLVVLLAELEAFGAEDAANVSVDVNN